VERSCECGNEPSGSMVPSSAGKLLSGFRTGGLLSSAHLHRVSQLDNEAQ
jgi:hypothetical protein